MRRSHRRCEPEKVLGQIELDACDGQSIPDGLAHGRLAFKRVGENDHLGTFDAAGAPSAPSL
jgi:hypothetical protein